MSIQGIHGTIDVVCDDCGKAATLPAHMGLLTKEWHCSLCAAKSEARRKFPRSITLHITKCEEHVFENMKDVMRKMASDCHAIIGSHSVESETHEIE